MHRTSILVVEDETLIAWDIKSVLEELGYRVPAITGYGDDAVRKAEEFKPDLILMDILLQGEKTGIEAAAEIQERFGTPVIYLTAHGDDAMLERVKSTTPYGYILKPFNERKLKLTIDIAMHKYKAEQTLIKQAQEISRLNRELEEKLKTEAQIRKENEELLVNQARMATMGEILGIIAHQWRQPLNTIALLNQEISDICTEKHIDTASLEKTIGKSLEQITFMSNTMDDFQSFLKPSPGIKFFDLSSVEKKTSSLLSPLLKYNDISLVVTGEFTRKLLVAGSMNEFLQALYNLVSNSCDAIQEKKCALPEHQGKIEITLRQKGKEAIVVVSDNGTGLSPETKDQLFAPYFSTKEEGKGTGIGLYITKMIVEKRMGGNIECESKPEGTSFIMTFPIREMLF